MKITQKRYGKSALSLLLSLCLLASCVSVSLMPTGAAEVEDDARVGNTNRLVYFTPYHGDQGTGWINSNVTIGARFCLSNNENYWLSATGSDTGRTIAGQRVYQVTVEEKYGGLDHLYFRSGNLESNTSNQQHAIDGWSAQGNWAGKYWDGDSWESNSYDTFKLKNNGSDIGTFTYSSGRKYTATVQLTAGTTYKLNVHDGTNYWASSGLGTMTSTDTKTLYRYGSGGSSDTVTITPTVTANFTFEWTLNGAGSREDAGSLKITFPTTYTVSYTLGSHVTKGTISGGTDNGSGTITAASGSTVVLNVSYADGYEYDSSASSLGGATANSSNTTFTFSSISANKTISIKAKQSLFNVTVTAGTGGTVSPSSFTGLSSGGGGTITATPTSGTNYVFSGWTANPAANVTFANAGSATTTFEATGAATITASFTQETLYAVTVYADGSTATTVNAGATIHPEITCADRSEDDYEFTGWTLTGNVSLASGYSATDTTIKVTATGTGTVTANYTHVDYIYFYGALQSNWNSNPVVTVDGAAIPVYRWIAQKDNTNLPAKTLYSGTDTSTKIGGNNCYTYYIGVYRVPVAKAGKNISVFNSTQTGTETNKGYCGTVVNVQGRCYYTYSTGENQNHSGIIAPQKVNTVTLNKSDYDGDETVTVSKTETVYSGTKTAGQDGFTYTYELINASTNAVVKTLATNQPSSTSDYEFIPDNKNIAAGSYKVVIHTRDATTNRIHNSCTSGTFVIQTTPTQSTVTFSGTYCSTPTGSYTYKNGSATAFNSGASLRAGSVVTLSYTLNEGYKNGTTTKSGVTTVTENYNSSTRKLTLTFTVPSGGTAIVISHAPDEIMHTVTLVRRYYDSAGSNEIASQVTQGTISAGIATAAGTGAAPSQTNYTFKKFVLPDSGVTKASGNLETASEITVNATADNKTIYLDYWETVYTITVQNDGHGKVQRGSTTVAASGSNGTTSIGNVTAVTLNAVNNEGYAFSKWQITKGTATKATVNGTTYNLGSSATEISGEANAASSFKFNGTATVKAVFTPVAYSISAAFVSGNAYANTNSVRVTDADGNAKSSGNIGDTYIIEVTLGTGYEVASITNASGTTPTPTKSGNVWKYSYTLGAASVSATVTLKAKTPTLTGVQIKNTSFAYASYNNNATVPHYYKQPDVAKATTDSFSTLSYSNGYSSVSGKASGAEASINANPNVKPTTENGTATYTLTVTATNAPAGVTAATTSSTFTISVSFNAKQKEYFKLSKIYSYLKRESTSGNPYYSGAADQIAAYNMAYDAATTFYNNGNYPAYNDTGTTDVYSNLTGALSSLMTKAITTTVYVLTNVPVSTSTPVNVSFSTNNNTADWDHFNMFSVYEGLKTGESRKISSDFANTAFHAVYDGYVQDKTNTNTKYYLYTFSYAGRAKFQVWKGTGTGDATNANTKKLTGVVTSAGDIGGRYYVNVYNVSAGNGSATTCTAWQDFGHRRTTTGKPFMEIGETKTAAQIKAMFGIEETGSVISDPGNIYTQNVGFTIEGPLNKASSTVVNLKTSNFTAPAQGKYRVTYTTRFGTKVGTNNYYDVPASYILYVAYDDVTVYVDMNDNVGTPILNFKYKANASGAPVSSGGTDAYLPYEMDLVTGSESVYKYTVKTSKLRDDYYLSFNSENPLNISYIIVENVKIGQNTGGFDITNDARIMGEVWFKADSTHLTTFNTIAYGSASTNFTAVTEDASHTVLTAAVKSIRGTGIITDEDEIYQSKYAASGTSDGLDDFGFTLRTVMNQEARNTNGTYYFDKWVRIATPADGLTVDDNNRLALNDSNKTLVTIPNNADYSDVSDITFTSAIPFNDGSCDYTYIALYKLAQANDPTVRVEVTYAFEDYDTTDGNYIYDPAKSTIAASYTKTVKVTDKTFAQAQADIEAIAKNNAPFIRSNYFDYTYQDNSAAIAENGAIAAQSKIKVTANFTHSPHPYTIVVKNGNSVVTTETGYYQQTKDLTAPSGISNPVWTDNKGNILASGATYTARFVASGFETDGSTDCQIIKVAAGSANAEAHKSVVTNSTTTVDNEGSSEILHHNFYIVDYCEQGKLVGGGVLFATGAYDANDNWTYRQQSATDNLDTPAHRQAFINSILSSPYNVEYTAQTISNIGFRYKPFKDTEDVFRYSDTLSAYLTVYEGQNTNSANYENQKLRLFSFMVYNSGTDQSPVYNVVVSDGYGEVDRYQPHTGS